MKDTLRAVLQSSQPVPSVIVRPVEAAACDVLESRELGQGALQLSVVKVEGIVVNDLAGVLKRLQKEPDLSQVSLCTQTAVREKQTHDQSFAGRTGRKEMKAK